MKKNVIQNSVVTALYLVTTNMILSKLLPQTIWLETYLNGSFIASITLVIKSLVIFGLTYLSNFAVYKLLAWIVHIFRNRDARGIIIALSGLMTMSILLTILNAIFTTQPAQPVISTGISKLFWAVHIIMGTSLSALLLLTEEKGLHSKKSQDKNQHTVPAKNAEQHSSSPLDDIDMLTEHIKRIATDAYKDREYLTRIAGVLIHVHQTIFRTSSRPMINLFEELANLKHYYALLQLKFGESLTLDVDIHKSLQLKRLPSLILVRMVQKSLLSSETSDENPMEINIKVSASGKIVYSQTLNPKLLEAQKESLKRQLKTLFESMNLAVPVFAIDKTKQFIFIDLP